MKMFLWPLFNFLIRIIFRDARIKLISFLVGNQKYLLRYVHCNYCNLQFMMGQK